jgi:hypothetical protein
VRAYDVKNYNVTRQNHSFFYDWKHTHSRHNGPLGLKIVQNVLWVLRQKLPDFLQSGYHLPSSPTGPNANTPLAATPIAPITSPLYKIDTSIEQRSPPVPTLNSNPIRPIHRSPRPQRSGETHCGRIQQSRNPTEIYIINFNLEHFALLAAGLLLSLLRDQLGTRAKK